MNETEARKVLLVRTIESLDGRGDVLPSHLRAMASALARRELAPESPPEPRSHDRFIVARAERLFQEAAARRPALRSLIDASPLVPQVAVALPIAGFVTGAVIERVLDLGTAGALPSAPLLILGWNLAVALVWGFARIRGRPALATPHPVVSAVSAWLSREWEGRFMIASRFTKAWLVESAPLLRARISGTLHLSAAMLALGCDVWIAAAGQVRGFPARVQSVVLLTLGVVLPRLVLWRLARRRARRLSAEFPLPLEGRYFRSLIEGDTAGAAATTAVMHRS